MLSKYFTVDTAIDAVIRFRWAVIVSVFGVTAWFAMLLPNLVLDGSMERIMLKGDPENENLARSHELFGSDEIIEVVIPYADSVWNETSIREIDELTNALEQIDGVKRIYSLSNSLVVQRGLVARSKTIMEWIENGTSAKKLSEEASDDPIIADNIVSGDGKHTALTIELLPLGKTLVGFKKRLTGELRQLLDQRLGHQGYHITGWPVVHTDIASSMLRDLRVLIPIVACVVTILLVFTYRRTAGVFLPLVAIGISQIWTIGGLVALGRSMSMVTNSLPVIIIAIGTTYCIHVMSQIFSELSRQPDQATAVRVALKHTMVSVILSGLTTMVGFGALKLSPVESIEEFGMFAVWGVGVSMFLSIAFLPSLALVIRLRPIAEASRKTQFDTKRYLHRIFANRRWIWLSSFAAVVICGYGISKIEVETAPLEWFAKDSETRISANYVNENMAGMTPFNVVLEFSEPNQVLQPSMLHRIDVLQRWLEQQPEVDTTISIVDPVKVAYRATRRGASTLTIPGDQGRVDKVMKTVRSGRIVGIDSLLTDNGSAANVFIRSSEVSTRKSVAFAERVNQYLAAEFPDAKLARITGSAFLNYRNNMYFTSGLMTSLSIGMGVIGLIMMLLFRSWKLGLLAMVPNVIPVVMNYGFLGLTNMNLNSATSITGCIAIGMAVDDTIHVLMAFREGLRQGLGREAAIEHAYQLVGRPMWVTSMTVAGGFSVLLFSSFTPVAELGLLVSLTMIAALACDALLLPVLLTAKTPDWAKIFRWRTSTTEGLVNKKEEAIAA